MTGGLNAKSGLSNIHRALLAEAVGSFMLFATVVGSGIMAERLAGGNVAVALLANTLATGAMLFVLITMLGPVSGAHFNPAVTLILRLRAEVSTAQGLGYVVVQLGGGILGVEDILAVEQYLPLGALAGIEVVDAVERAE